MVGIDSLEQLVDVLVHDHSTWRDDPAIGLRYEKGSGKQAHDLKAPPHRFRAYLEHLRDTTDERRSRAILYASAFGSESVVDNSGNVKPTALHFTAGQQEFLSMVEQLIERVTEDDLLEALRGPWKYEKPLPVLQWDATAVRQYALRANDPSTDKKLGVPGADWLAFRALSFFRVAPRGTRLVTAGCEGGWKAGHFTWPVWTVPVSAVSVGSLVGYPNLADMSSSERTARGIGSVFRSRIKRSEQGGYGSFAPAQVV